MTVDLEVHEDSRASESEPVTIPVRYDGADLADVAGHLRVSREDVIAAPHGGHLALCVHRVRTGFRLPELRRRSAHGATAGPVPHRGARRVRGARGWLRRGVSPRSSPGGWQIIGTTDSPPMWNLDANPPALLQPGRRVRFVDEETL